MTRLAMLLAVLLVPVGCTREPVPTPAATASSNAAPSPTEALDRLDARVPVPLLPMMANHQKQNMRDHLVAVQEIVRALATDDFAGVERAVARVGFSDRDFGQIRKCV